MGYTSARHDATLFSCERAQRVQAVFSLQVRRSPPQKKIDDWAFEPDSVESVPTHKQPLQARPPAEGPLAALSQMDHPDAREGPLVHGHVVTEWSARCRERGRFSRWRLRSRLSGAIRNVLRGI